MRKPWPDLPEVIDTHCCPRRTSRLWLGHAVGLPHTHVQQKSRRRSGGLQKRSQDWRRWGIRVLCGLLAAVLLAHGCHREDVDDEPLIVPPRSDQRPEEAVLRTGPALGIGIGIMLSNSEGT